MPHYGVLIKYAVPWMLSRAHLRKHRSRKTKVMMAFALFRKSQLMGGNLVIIINTHMMHQFTGKTMVTGFSNLESPLKVCILSHRIIKLPSRWSFSYWSWVGGRRLQSAWPLPTYSACFAFLPFYCWSTCCHYHCQDEKAETKQLNGLTEVRYLSIPHLLFVQYCVLDRQGLI